MNNIDLILIKMIAIKKSKKIYFNIPYHHQKHGSGLEGSIVKIVMILQLILPSYILSYHILVRLFLNKVEHMLILIYKSIQKQNNENELYKSPRAVELNVNN